MESDPHIADHALKALVDYLDVADGACEGTLYRRILIAEENAFARDQARREGIERCLLLCRDRIRRQEHVIQKLKTLGSDIVPAQAFMTNLLFTQQVLLDM